MNIGLLPTTTVYRELFYHPPRNINDGFYHSISESPIDSNMYRSTCFSSPRDLLHQALQSPIEDDRAAKTGSIYATA
jgi:hypothetical protein